MPPPVTDESAQSFFERARSVHAFRVARDGTIEACNDAAAENLGAPPAEVIGRPIFHFLTAPDADRLRGELQTRGRRDEPLLLNFCDARQIPYTLECWLDADAGHATIVGEPPLRSDQNLQRELMKVAQDLAVLTRERSRLVAAERHARMDAEAADREKDRALATIAHELRQPIGTMRFALDLLAAEAPAAARDRALRTLARQISQLSRMVDDLLDVARIRENKLQLDRAPLDLTALLGEVADNARSKAASASIEFESVMPEGPLWVQADAARIMQVFSNLLDNAFKYTEPGGRVAVRVALESEMACVTVSDTGRGISPTLLPKVFRLFAQQGEGERGGLGVGLAVAQGIVAMHGGTIEARSDGLGHGSSFVVRLPLAAQGSGVS